MGRNYRTAYKCEEVLRLELSFLLNKGFLTGGARIGELSWTNGSNIHVIAAKKLLEVTLKYSVNEERRSERIQLTTVPSNLGKGEVLYFICPKTGGRCRVLYFLPNSPRWMGRKAYGRRLVYSIQAESKMNYARERFFRLEKTVEKLKTKEKFTPYFKGKPTKAKKRLDKLTEEMWEWENEMWMPRSMPIGLRRGIGIGFINTF